MIIEKLYNINVAGVEYQQMSESWIRNAFPNIADDLIFQSLKNEALVGVDRIHAELLNKLTGNASVEERDTWQAKELAARAYVDNVASPPQTLMIETEATYVGLSPPDHCARVIEKAEEFYQLIGLAGGIRSKARAAIKAATTQEELDVAIVSAQADVEAGLVSISGQ